MKARRLMLGSALGLLAVWGGSFWPSIRGPETAQRGVVDERNESLARMSRGNQKRLDALRADLNASLVEPSSLASDPSSAASTSLLHAAKVLQASARMIDRSEIHTAEIEALCSDPASVALMRRIAVDHELARELFGDDQAAARVTAIRALAHLARSGHPEAVAEAVEALAVKLNETEKWDKGIQHDFTDLLESHVRALGKTQIMKDPDGFFRQVGLSARTRVHVAQALTSARLYDDLAPKELEVLRSSYYHFIPQGG